MQGTREKRPQALRGFGLANIFIKEKEIINSGYSIFANSYKLNKVSLHCLTPTFQHRKSLGLVNPDKAILALL